MVLNTHQAPFLYLCTETLNTTNTLRKHGQDSGAERASCGCYHCGFGREGGTVCDLRVVGWHRNQDASHPKQHLTALRRVRLGREPGIRDSDHGKHPRGLLQDSRPANAWCPACSKTAGRPRPERGLMVKCQVYIGNQHCPQEAAAICQTSGMRYCESHRAHGAPPHATRAWRDGRGKRKVATG